MGVQLERYPASVGLRVLRDVMLAAVSEAPELERFTAGKLERLRASLKPRHARPERP